MFEIAICIYDEILYLRPSGHKLHAAALLQLGEALRLSYTERPVDTARLHKAINLLRQAVGLISLGDPRRRHARQGLVAGLLTSFPGQSGIAEVHTGGVDICREVLGLYTVDDPERAAALKLLAGMLLFRFHKLGDSMALAEAIETLQQALDSDPPYSAASSNLETTLPSRGSSSEEDVESKVLAAVRGIMLELLSGSPPDQSHRSDWVEILGVMLMARFEHQNDVEALARAVNLQREAVGLHPAGHPNRAEALNKLATSLLTQFGHDGDGNVLAEAVDLNREALSLRPCGHHERLTSLNNLARALQYRFDQQRDFSVLAETIDLQPSGSGPVSTRGFHSLDFSEQLGRDLDYLLPSAG
jgi:tetratricopeptide (TPR) repeat protein